ncbi:MAG: hypothetical protein U5N58_14905 [Actinomycetota bacterium]|nr:hypothetical protein [Actinomycetota bacterium]
MADTGNIPERKDVPQHLRWQPEDLFQDYEQWKSRLSAASNKLKVVAGSKDRLSESADTLYEAISIYEKTAKTVEKIFFYAHLKKDEDNSCSQYQAMLDQAQNLLIQFEAAASFLIPEILSLDEAFLKNALDESRFKDYAHFLNNLLRKKAHVLSSREEEILALSGEIAQAPRYIFSMINDADIKFPQIEDQQGNATELTKGNFIKFMENRDRQIRKKAFNQLYGTYSKQKNTIAATLCLFG